MIGKQKLGEQGIDGWVDVVLSGVMPSGLAASSPGGGCVNSLSRIGRIKVRRKDQAANAKWRKGPYVYQQFSTKL